MGTHTEAVSYPTKGSGQRVELLLPGYTDSDADHLLSILHASGQSSRLHQFYESTAEAHSTENEPIDVVIVHLDQLTTAPPTVIEWVRMSHPQAEIILASSTPAKHTDLADKLEIQNLFDCRDSLRIALAIRRSYRKKVSRRKRTRPEEPGVADHKKPIRPHAQNQAGRATPEPVQAELNEGNETPELHALFRPLVSLDGDSRAHYLVNPSLFSDNGNSFEPASTLKCKHLSSQLSEIDVWLVEQAAEKLAAIQEKAGLHLAISEESLKNDTLLLRTCESLRRFNVRGSNLHFNFDATLLKEENRLFLRFLSGLKKVNCHICCRNVDDTQGLPALLSRYDVHMAQYAESTLKIALDQPEYAERLANTNLEIQRRGIKTLAGNVGDPETLTLLWGLGVNYVWGDFLHPL